MLSSFEAKIEAKLAKKNKKKHKSNKASATVSSPEELQAPEPEARGGGVNVPVEPEARLQGQQGKATGVNQDVEPVAQKVVEVPERVPIDPDIDPLGLMQDDDDCHDGDVLYTYPEESESFLDDRDFLPKEVKRAHARKLLYSHTGSKKVECDQTAGPSGKAPEEPESMLIKFLKSIPSGDSKEELGSQDFEGMFAAAPSFASERKTPCFELDQQQVLLLRKFWQCPKPNKLAAFSEESFKLLKVEEKFMPVTQVPTLDSFVKMVNEKQGPTTKEGYRHKMWQNFEYDLRRVHKGARVSFLADALGQRILFSLGELFRTWLADSTLSQLKFEEANQLLLGAFESSNRSLEQAARIGGMIHQLRRRVILEDLQVPVKKRDAWLALGLSPEGIMGAEFTKQLEDVDKLSREYKASARQLGIATRGGFKRSGEHQSSGGPPMKRPFRDWQSQSGSEGQNDRGSFSFQRGRGRGRGRGTCQGAQSGQQAAAGRGRGRGSAGSQPPQFWRQRGSAPSQSWAIPLPEVPVGGRLLHFREAWHQIVSDEWVLEVIGKGYALEFSELPPRFQGVKCTRVTNAHQSQIYQSEIATLLQKRVIQKVPYAQREQGFYSTMFLVPKRNSTKLRPVINLRPLNQYLWKRSFKMEHLRVVIATLKPGIWAISIDLADAYFHVPIRPIHHKFLRFALAGQSYQFRALPFGPTTAPRVFTKIVSAVVEYLRQ